MLTLPIEIIQHVTNFCDLRNTLNIMMTCQKYNQHLYIYSIDKKNSYFINDDILCQNKFRFLREIHVGPFVKQIGFLKNLKKVIIDQKSIIGQDSMQDLDLIELKIFNNKNIKHVAHMKNLKILYIYGKCGIDQNEINKLNVYELCVSFNPYVHDVSHMTRLRRLHARCGLYRLGIGSEYCEYNIDQAGIKNLDLRYLDIVGNTKIITVSHMKNLGILIHNVPQLFYFNKTQLCITSE